MFDQETITYTSNVIILRKNVENDSQETCEYSLQQATAQYPSPFIPKNPRDCSRLSILRQMSSSP